VCNVTGKKNTQGIRTIFNISLLMPSGPHDFLFFKDLSASTTSSANISLFKRNCLMLYQSLVYIHTYGEITLSNPYLRVVVLVTLQITGVLQLPYLVVWGKFSQNSLYYIGKVCKKVLPY
jgi:hypothetical protein